MKNLQAIRSKTKQILEALNRKNAYFYFMPLKGAVSSEDRKILRKKLIEEIKNNFKPGKQQEFNWNKLMNTGVKPDCPFASISISHCRKAGAFVFVLDKSISIGFDIEEAKRISKKSVSRVASIQEIEQAPFPALLWSAKEAGFKCLSDQVNRLMLRGCMISRWRKNQVGYFFECHSGDKKAGGMASLAGGLVLAYAEIQLSEKTKPDLYLKSPVISALKSSLS